MLNSCNFIGFLGSTPEIKNLESGTKIASFSLATSEKWKDKSGNVKERTTWINCTVFGNQADVVEKYLDKGSKIHVEARYSVDEVEKDGQKRYFPKFIVNRFIMLDSKKDSAAQSSGAPVNQMPSSGSQSSSYQEDEEDRLPF